MGDSDDDYDAMGKRRGQNRNKFRKERDDYHGNASDSMNDMHDGGSMRRNKGGTDNMMGNGGGGGANRMSHGNNGGAPAEYRRRTLGGAGAHYSHKEFDDLDEDDLAHQTYRDPGFR